MSTYRLTVNGNILTQADVTGTIALSRDGVKVYEYTDAAPAPPGSIPAGAVLWKPTPEPGVSAQPLTALPGVLYYFVPPIPRGSLSITKGPGSLDYSIKSALSAPQDAGNWIKAAAMPVQRTGGFGGGTTTVYPYYAAQNFESAGLGWTSTADGSGMAVIQPGWVYSFMVSAAGPVVIVAQIPQQ